MNVAKLESNILRCKQSEGTIIKELKMEKPKFSSLYGNDFLDHLYEATWSETHEKTAFVFARSEKEAIQKVKRNQHEWDEERTYSASPPDPKSIKISRVDITEWQIDHVIYDLKTLLYRECRDEYKDECSLENVKSILNSALDAINKIEIEEQSGTV